MALIYMTLFQQAMNNTPQKHCTEFSTEYTDNTRTISMSIQIKKAFLHKF